MIRKLINRETGEEMYRGKWFGGDQQEVEMLKPEEPTPDSELEAPAESDEEENEGEGESESILSPWGVIENEAHFFFTYKNN